MRYSIGMLKPDCLERALEPTIISLIESHGLRILVAKIVNLTQAQIDVIYDCCRHESYYKPLSEFLRSGPCNVFIVESNNAIDKLNDLVGPSDPQDGRRGQLRHDFGETLRRNIIHSTKNETRFWNELHILFNRQEMDHLSLFTKTGSILTDEP